MTAAAPLQHCTLFGFAFRLETFYTFEPLAVYDQLLHLSAYRCPYCGRPMLRPEQGEATEARCVSAAEWERQLLGAQG